MGKPIPGAVVGFVVGLYAAGVAAEEEKPFAIVQKFIDSFNKGDAAGAAATHSATADLAIMDEVPPYLWSGAQAFRSWGATSKPTPRRTASPTRQ